MLAANVDVALVVTSLDGDFNLRRLERYLAVAWTGGATPVIVLNKADVADDPAGLRVAAEAVAPGRRGPDDLRPDRRRRRGARRRPPAARPHRGRARLARASASPRSSTRCWATQRQRTGAVRDDDSRGRHTTTHRELVRLPAGALLIDTPGIRSLGVAGAADGLETAFADIADLAVGCRFRDCRHDGEPGCAVAGRARRRAASTRPGSRATASSSARRPTSPAQSDPLRQRRGAAHVEGDPRLGAIHMKHKYGSDR